MSLPTCEPADVSLAAHEPKEVRLAVCEHIKPAGQRCGSPALRDEKYCYYHADVRKRVPKTNLFVRLWNASPERDSHFSYDLPFLEDPAAIQIGFMQLIHGVAQERLQPSRAKLILSALHGAAANLRLMDKAMTQRERGASGKKEAASVKAAKKQEQSA